MRRVSCILAAVCLIASAAFGATVTVGSVAAECGGVSSIGLTITEPAPFRGVNFTVRYDPSALEFFAMQPGLEAEGWYVNARETAGEAAISLRPPSTRAVNGPAGILLFLVRPGSVSGSTTIHITDVKTLFSAVSTDGTGSMGTVSFTCSIGMTQPPPPPAITARPLTSTSAELRFDPIEGASGYRIFRGTTQIHEGPDTRVIDSSGLAAGTRYCYSARSIGAAGESAQSPAACITTPVECTAPSSAPQVSAVSRGTSGVSVTWTPVDNAASYRLLRDGVPVFEGPALSFEDDGLAAASQFCYTVVALSSCGNGPASAPVCAMTAANCSLPDAAPELTPITAGPTAIRIAWAKVAGATHYRLSRQGQTIFTGTSTIYDDVLLLSDTPYCYRVAAVNGCGEVASAERCGETASVSTQRYVFSHLAGSTGGPGTINGRGSQARFYFPYDVAADGVGNLYVADTFNHTIRKVSANGIVSTHAGSPGQPGAIDGPLSSARLNLPTALAFDGAGNLFVVDSGNHLIRRITPSGEVTTLAGSPGETGSADGLGAEARFRSPSGIAVDASGNILVSDTLNHTIRLITPDLQVSTLAGLAGASGRADGERQEARFSRPAGIAVDAAGNIFVADSLNSTIRRISSAGIVSTLAGVPGQAGSADGPVATAQFDMPFGVAVDGTGSVLVSETVSSTIRRISPDGVVSTVAGRTRTYGAVDAVGTDATLFFPRGIDVDTHGVIYVADTDSHIIRQIASDLQVSTLAGLHGGRGSADGNGDRARFNLPFGVAVDSAGTVYVADSDNFTIRRITPDGIVTTLAGSPGMPGSVDGSGADARFLHPFGIAVGPQGDLFVADRETVRHITSEGDVTTIAGEEGMRGADNGPGEQARFDELRSIGVDDAGNIYVADTFNHTIRKITPEGVVSTLAGTAGQQGALNGTGSSARFFQPYGVAVDADGTVFVADSSNATVRKITPAGQVTTVAGATGQFGSADGTGDDALFDGFIGIALDSDGNLYAANRVTHTVRKITPDGVVTTIAGAAGLPGTENGFASTTRLTFPRAVAVGHDGTLYIAEQFSIRQGLLCPGNTRCPAPAGRRRGARK